MALLQVEVLTFYLSINEVYDNIGSQIPEFPRIGLLSMAHHRSGPRRQTPHQTLTYGKHPIQSVE